VIRSTLFCVAAAVAASSVISCANAPKTESTYSGLGRSSVPEKVLREFAPPPLDPRVARRISSMLDIKAPGLGILTPDGRQLFFGWSISGSPQVWRLSSPRGFPQQVTGGKDQTSVVGITPNGQYLVLSRDRDGEEAPGIYLQSVNGGSLIEVFHKPNVRASAQWVSDDSRYIYYAANDVKPDSFIIYEYEVSSGSRTPIFSEPGLWSLTDVKGKDQFLMAKWTGSRSSEFYVFDRNTKKMTPVIGQNEREEYEVAFGPRADEFLVLTNKLGNFRRLYRLQKGQLSALTKDRGQDVESFRIDKQRKRVLIEWNDQGYTRLEAFDALNFKPIPLPAFANADHVYIGTMSRDGRYVTIGVETAKAPRTSYVYDWQTQRLTQWVLPSSPEINTAAFAEAKLETYPARDGTKIPMLVRRPASCPEKPCPVVVHFHGGPEGQSRPGFSTFAQMFVDAGFVFVEPNVRGSEGFGKEWLTADDGPKRLKVVTDIEDAALFIRKNWAEGGREPKIGVMGWSYGGYSTLYAMTRFAGAYDAGVSLVGISNLVTFLMNTAPYRRQLRITEYGDPEKDRAALIELSPITHLKSLRDPLLIIQGASDPRVPVGEAIQMHQALKKKKIDSQLIVFADEGHGSVKRENQVLELGHTLAFFEKHLKTGAVPVIRK